MLEDGVQSSRYAYTALISGLVKKNMIAKGCVYLDRMIEESFMPNTVLYTSLVKQFLRKREFEFAFKLIDLMERSEIEWDLVTYITLVRGVSRNIRSLDGKWLVPQRLKMTTDSQVHDTAMTVAATNVATTSSTNAPPAMAPAEKLDKFAGIDFKRWQQKIFLYLTTLCLQRFTFEEAPKDFKNYLKYKRKEMTVEDLIVRLRIEEDNKAAEKRSKENSAISRENIIENDHNNFKRRKKARHENNQPKKNFKEKCFNYGKIGHKSTDCRIPKKGKKKDQENMTDSKKETDDMCVMLSECNLMGNPREYGFRCNPPCSKWIFKRKMKADGTIDKYKARLVVKGFKQKECLDYFDTYSPVMRITLIRMLITLAVVCGLKIHQMNVKTSFLNGELEEEIYMEQLEGFVVPGKENKSKFDMKDLGVADVILGKKIHRTPQGLALSQSHYIKKSKDNMSDPLTKDLSRERVKRTSKGMDLRPRTSQHSGNSTKQTGDLKS
ncbi:putative glucan endo-1,3-beta-glucosidase A-like [Capsicum annuum]|nr:putative glucan endo-1,3-beta-glucosidase A-like [Capsicum annuum]